MKKNNKTPWPTKAAMSQVYALNLWGDNQTEFYSGSGSHDLAIVTPYVEAIINFLKRFNEPLKVCDLGCGDFNVGKQIVDSCSYYHAIDIVPELIAHNKQQYKQDFLEFSCLDISKDLLPEAHVVFLRQVLQHLSNTEVQQILFKLKTYPYVIVTEHIPREFFTPNKDIISGQGTRLKQNSGLVLSNPPFTFNFKKQENLLSLNLEPHKGKIVTTLYQMF